MFSTDEGGNEQRGTATMTSLSPSQDGDLSGSSKPHPSRRRDKPQLSCTLCRKRRLKCDRKQPCETCSRRGLSLSCTYVINKPPERLDRNLLLRPPASASVQDRLGQLEKLVIDTLNTAKPDTPLTGDKPDDISQLSRGFGRISIENSEIYYVESAHWSAILDGIGELRDYFEVSEMSCPENPSSIDSGGLELLFGQYKRVRKQDLLASVPPRPVVDRFVAKCFNCMDMAPLIIHRPTFLKEYERFWQRPLGVPIMWLGMLFSIICAGHLFHQFSSPEIIPPVPQQSPSDPGLITRDYREKIAQCLVLGNYTRSIPYTIETLLIYLNIEYSGSKDTNSGCWVILGIITRLAIRMGYHREPSNFPRISPFQAEMRRRVWLLVNHLDIFVSAQMGLPRMIKESQSDTAEPRNLLDEDLGINMTKLPPSRPDTFETTTLYFKAKGRIVSVFGIINDLTTSPKSIPYMEYMQLDKMLDDAYRRIPQWLRIRPMSSSIMVDSQTIISRLSTALLYHSSKCVLHRTHMLPARRDHRYEYSRRACIENALSVLELQNIVDQETQVGGRLYNDRWKISLIIKVAFFLATTILCIDLNHTQKSSDQLWSKEHYMTLKISSALKASYPIWLRSSSSSQDAQKVVKALEVVFGKTATPPMTTGTSPEPQQRVDELERINIANQLSSIDTQFSNFNSPEFAPDLVSNWPTEFDMTIDDFNFEAWDSEFQTANLNDLLEITNGLTSSNSFDNLPRFDAL